jgi:hypothetical protein
MNDEESVLKLQMVPAYKMVREKEYCCVPAVLQMIQSRRGLAFDSQDEIGFQLGLIVPPELEHKFTKVRTGPEPDAGYGTQTSLPEFSIADYFKRNRLPLKITLIRPQTIDELKNQLTTSIDVDEDVIICYNSRLLFGEGDVEHVSLIQEFDTEWGNLLVADPAVSAPFPRKTTLDRLSEVITAHGVSSHGGLWVVSSSNRIA